MVERIHINLISSYKLHNSDSEEYSCQKFFRFNMKILLIPLPSNEYYFSLFLSSIFLNNSLIFIKSIIRTQVV